MGRYAAPAPEGAGNLPRDSSCRIGIVAQIGSFKYRRLEAVMVRKAPERSFKTMHHIARAADLLTAFALPRALRNLGDAGAGKAQL